MTRFIKLKADGTQRTHEENHKKYELFFTQELKQNEECLRCREKLIEEGDPILLAQSPFGHVWQILGAWDEEMVLLEEL